MLLKRNILWDTYLKLISESTEFIYLISAWIGPKFAKSIKEMGAAKDVVIVIRDLDLVNNKITEYLEDFDIRIFKERPLHDKILLTNLGVMSGSANFTWTSFFKEENTVQYYDNLAPEWKEFYEYSTSIINKSIKISTLMPYINKAKLNFNDLNSIFNKIDNKQKIEKNNSFKHINLSKQNINIIKLPNKKLSLPKLHNIQNCNDNNNYDNKKINNIIRLLKKL